MLDLANLQVNLFEAKKEVLIKEGYKQIEEYPNYFINTDGDLLRLKDNGALTRAPLSNSSTGTYKTNLFKKEEGKKKLIQSTVQVHILVYSTFKGKSEGSIYFIDGDKHNIKLNNLITSSELLEYYRKHENIK